MADFSEEKIQKVWEKGSKVEGYDENRYRQDTCGAWMEREKYGDQKDNFGWEIDHVYPDAKGGGNELQNLRPMNWANNRSKADNFPSYSCAVTSDGNKNVSSEKKLTVYDELKKVLSEKYEK